MHFMRNLCIIPARGGSKRIPRKNIKNFLGKPIIAYSIEMAIQSGLFVEVMVSTDSEEIAEIAIKYGAIVPFLRSNKNSDDFAATVDVIEEVILRYENVGQLFDNCCCIYPTAPFVTPVLLKLGLDHLSKNEFDSVFSIMKFSFPIQRAIKIENGKIQMCNPENISVRSQDLEETFHDAGQFYWIKPKKILSLRKIITDNSGGIIIKENEAQDIDTFSDWELAELKYKRLNKL